MNLRVVLAINAQYQQQMGLPGCAMTSWSAVVGAWPLAAGRGLACTCRAPPAWHGRLQALRRY